ncbi:hypothetical protein TYRP_017567 [Tyrophagus putrescentiae]|nr:hypothetical protein TYRP_017567 [Tyrophagus putrescentiae]
MYTNQFFPKFHSAVLFQKRSPVQAHDQTASHQQSSYSSKVSSVAVAGGSGIGSGNGASGSLVLLVSLSSAFMLLALLGTTFYYYHQKRRSSWTGSGLGGSGGGGGLGNWFRGFGRQVNPFQKKSPSPTSATASVFSSSVAHGFGAPITEEHHQKQSKAAEINNNKPKRKCPAKQSSLENLHDEANISGASKKKERSLSSSSKKNSLDGGNLGQLHFKLKYSYEKRSLSVVVVRCEGLQSSNKTDGGSSGAGLLDPYVKLQLLPEKQHKAKTRVLRKTVSPVYNEEFTFLGIAASSLDNLVVHFVVLNFDRFARDEILGEVVCKVNQLEFDALEKQISLTREIAPRGNKLKIQELGELLVSLCYQPIANRLTVVVLKARNLPKMDLTGLCDPYVKLYVFHNGVRIFKKRTHVKKRTLSPVFNESFVFDIPPEEGLENISLQFQVYDHDRVTRNELIGKVDISGRTPGSPATEKHWHEVIRSPRRQIAEWHKLKEC